ncbi:hypothetical protein MLD38_002709 [Melastoma candidum]|uniref:Uncharacterized protein n=1 Tax=Melastoma candidum TaxID=119954 RepID=A0ACB9S1T1_9MYRT|nr:hypothetical protein MLD38_002709 [Melastoma candidum]
MPGCSDSITCFILVCLFALQHYGTHRIGFLFAPIVLTWLLCISSLGFYNILRWNPRIYKALSPYHMLRFIQKTRLRGWMSLGGILLCITGAEAMFADLGHFSYTAIQIAFTAAVYPALILAYMGQAAYLSQHHHNQIDISFYATVPDCHTSDKKHGQIYIPEINWMLMISCIAVTCRLQGCKAPRKCFGAGSDDSDAGDDMPHIVELLYFSASLTKFTEGACLPILLALFLMTIMFIWHYTTIKKYEFDLHNKVSLKWLLSLGQTLGIASPCASCPPEERYLVGHVGPPSHRSYRCIIRYGYCNLHQDVGCFESELGGPSCRSLSSTTGLNEETRVPNFEGKSNSSSNEQTLTVIGRNNNSISETWPYNFEESWQPGSVSAEFSTVESLQSIVQARLPAAEEKKVRFAEDDNDSFTGADPVTQMETEMREGIKDLLAARESGMAILEHSHVRAKQGSSLLKRLAINLGYNFLKRNCRRPDVVLKVPPVSLLEVGMVYVV